LATGWEWSIFHGVTDVLSKTWLILNSGACAPAENMALDEVLLELVAEVKRPILRFYGWTEPAATFGYFQKYADVELMTGLRPLLRRPTGGGLVPHKNDWTYSVAFPPGHEWYQLKAEESYQRVHEWIRDAFKRLGLDTELSPCCQKDMPGQCFIGAEKYDLLCGGKKIAGAAQRRNKHGLLIQGSVQPPPLKVTRVEWQEAMKAVAEHAWEVAWENLAADTSEQVARLVREKYGVEGYNRKR
jgi:lipoate-protein ligase A